MLFTYCFSPSLNFKFLVAFTPRACNFPPPVHVYSMLSFLPSLSYAEQKYMSRTETRRQEKDTPKGPKLGFPSPGTPFCPVLEAKLSQCRRSGGAGGWIRVLALLPADHV